MKMSVETARAFGKAMGMWAYENGSMVRSKPGFPDACDCVVVEETDVYAELSKEWEMESNGDLDESEQYDTAFKEMYETVKKLSREAREKRNWDARKRRGVWANKGEGEVKICPGKLPETTLEQVMISSSDEDISLQSPARVFDDWCNYEGLIGYGPRIRRIWTDLVASTL